MKPLASTSPRVTRSASWSTCFSPATATPSAATALLALRLLIIYFEVFGTLLSTGIGLISGGLLTLGLAWLWSRGRREFAAELAPGDAPPPSQGENAP